MSDNFKALIVNQTEKDFTREIKTIDKSFLKHGDVFIKVEQRDIRSKRIPRNIRPIRRKIVLSEVEDNIYPIRDVENERISHAFNGVKRKRCGHGLTRNLADISNIKYKFSIASIFSISTTYL